MRMIHTVLCFQHSGARCPLPAVVHVVSHAMTGCRVLLLAGVHLMLPAG
jgi:hypothetical protein